MDVEYQKKEVTWCLDRDGPRICLRAVSINGNLKSLDISSERFHIIFENNEARDFLSVLRKIVEEKSLPKSHLFQEIPIDDTDIQETAALPAQEIPFIQDGPKLDTSEILNVLKQSENNIDDSETPLLDLLTDQKDLNLGLNDKSIISDDIPDSDSGISIEENVKPSELFRESIDTASFFRGDTGDEISEEKTPLEQLLEGDEESDPSPIAQRDTIVTTVHEENIPRKIVTEEKTEITPFTPEDLSSTAFISNFDSKIEEEIDETSAMDEIQDPLATADDESQHTESTESIKSISFEERRRRVEKEREARKKRLWELTRGF